MAHKKKPTDKAKKLPRKSLSEKDAKAVKGGLGYKELLKK